MTLQKTGYDSNTFLANAALGVFDGADSVLWCYAFASIVFSGVLTIFLPLGLVIMLGGWALLSIFVALTSRAPVHMIAIDEQAVVIVGSISVLMISSFGDEAASPRGLATILAIMSLVSFAVAISFFLASRYHLARLLELLPYPVICGFMAGIGWLLLDAGIMVALDIPISLEFWHQLSLDNNLARLALCLVGGFFLLIFTNRFEHSWALPVASTTILVLFYAVSYLLGYEITVLRAQGWIFDIQTPEGGIPEMLAALTLAHIDIDFMVSVAPQMITVVFLTMLAASMNLSAMTAINLKARMKAADEMQGMGGGNILCGLICCPPGYTDAPASILYEGFGATSRWMPLASSFVCLLVAVSGDWFISYTPKVLIGATIFLFALQLFYDWMYANVRNFSISDYAIVCIILLTVISFGFMQGILIGIVLTVLVFVLRYSMIPAIQDQFTLIDHRSSVERSLADDRQLERYGGEALVYKLRGYLFFGTANTVRDSVRDNIENGHYSLILLDLRRVTGIDISAMNAFAQLKQVCDGHGIQLFYSCSESETRDKLVALDAVSISAEQPLVFPTADYAIEKMEETLLARYASQSDSRPIRYYLKNLVVDDTKVERLLKAMIRIECWQDDFLFHQGDPDTGFYVLESGHLSATIDTGRGISQRLMKFTPGSVIGELTSYTLDGTRTASVVADTDSILYYLNPESLGDTAIVHELVARTMGVRMEYMHRRLMWELV